MSRFTPVADFTKTSCRMPGGRSPGNSFAPRPFDRLARSLGLAALLLAALLPAMGCTPAAPPVAGDPTTAPGTSPDPGDPPDRPAAKEEVRELWDAYFIKEAKVGHAHTRIEPAPNGDVHVISTSRLTLRRFGQTVTQEMLIDSLETAEGVPKQFRTRLESTGTFTETQGRLEEGQLLLEVTTQGKTIPSRLEWQSDWQGLFAVENSLRRKPMKPGEERKMLGLMPVFNTVAEMTLKAVVREATPLLDGSQVLLRVESSVAVGEAEIPTTLWCDDQGEVLKTFVPALEKYAYRTSMQRALADDRPREFDLGEASVVPLKQRLPDPHSKAKIVYRARLGEMDPASVFALGVGQQVSARQADGSCLVTVRAIRPDTPGEQLGPASPPAGAEDRSPNNFIQSDDPRIVRLATQVAAEEKDAWKVAVALEKLVRQRVTSKNFSQSFATAAEVAEKGEGDCTEHAVLLAALCRARDIPCRVAIGLVYYPAARGFAYHMWNEAWIEDRWIPLDGTLAQGGIGGGHLKLTDSSLKGASAYTAFLPVFSVLGRLELEVVSVE